MGKRWLASGAIAVGLVAAGCGGSVEQTADPGESSTTAASGSSAGCSMPADGATLTSILGVIPDTPENRSYVAVADLRAFLDDQDATLPEDTNEIRFVDPVARFTPTLLLQQAIIPADGDEDPLQTEYGISIGQVDQAVSVGEPPDMTELFIGSFEPADVKAAVAADPVWSEDVEEATGNGQTYYSWGEDNETQLERITTMRTLGIGGRMFASDTVAGFTRSTAVMDALLAGCAGAAPTLADDDAFLGIAERLDAFDGAFNSTLTDQLSDGSSDSPRGSAPATASSSDDSKPLEGVTAYGFASGRSDDPEQARIRLVIASETDEQAAANEAVFTDHIENGASVVTRQPWSELVRIDRTEVDGRFLIVELQSDNSGVLDKNLMTRDSLIVTGG